MDQEVPPKNLQVTSKVIMFNTVFFWVPASESTTDCLGSVSLAHGESSHSPVPWSKLAAPHRLRAVALPLPAQHRTNQPTDRPRPTNHLLKWLGNRYPLAVTFMSQAGLSTLVESATILG